MSAHTPGPWRVNEGGVVVSAKPEVGICDPFPCDRRPNGDYTYGEETDANRRLIASAPDMRAALDRIDAALREFEGMKGTYAYVASCIRAAMREPDAEAEAREVNERE